MRFKKIELKRYGKFTDEAFQFPRVRHDFHAVIGPNEAGKSTFRSGVTDVLFGIEPRTPLGFKHGMSELVLGASIEDAASALEFLRIKAAKNTLRAADLSVLPADALSGFLGGSDRSFFGQMFCLDRGQLLKGGEHILDASNDVGQILFESAAGVASLGAVRDQLEAEASQLWSARSSDRVYARAAKNLDLASGELRSVTVRPKVWCEAQEAVDEIRAEIEEVQKQRDQHQRERNLLERIRRLAPQLSALRAKRAALAQIGNVPEVPMSAGETLSKGQAALAEAITQEATNAAAVAEAETSLAGIVYQSELLPYRQEIEALADMRVGTDKHEGDIRLRLAEIEVQLREAAAIAEGVGWPVDEQSIRERLVGPALKAISRLLQTRGSLLQSRRSADEALAEKAREFDRLDEELKQHVGSQAVPAGLRAALSEAQGKRHFAAQIAEKKSALQGEQKRLEVALQALAPWVRSLEDLEAGRAPTEEQVSVLRDQMRDSEVHVQAARRAADAAKDQSAQSALALRQFEASNLVVTASDVRAERDARDVIWNAIKSGLSVISESAEDLDRGIKAADDKADGLLANATEAERLQSLRDVAEADADKARTAEAGWSARARERAELDEQWRLLASRFALDEMPIGEALAWLGRRSTAVGVADRIKIAKEEYATLAADFDATWQALKSELAAVGTQFPDSLSMSWLIQAAESFVGSAEKARADRSGLEARLAACGAHQLVLQDRTLAAHAEFREWESEWRQAITAAHLDGVATGVAEVGAAAEAAQGLSAILQKIDSVRRERVDTMQADLNRLDETAARLGVKVGGLPDGLTGREVSFELSSRLAASIAGKTLYDQAAMVLDRAKARRQESKAKIDQITASLDSTLKLVGVTTVPDALQVVEISERKRRLTAELGDETRTILQSGDGLDLARIETEVDGATIGDIPVRLDELNDLLSGVSDALTQLTERRVQAEQKLSAIAGGESAAIAESKRHEAIADMVEAADRYLRVKTSAALLRWATERYRETHQGPLLKRAGEIFSGLTLGQFSRLVVDFEKKPFELSARTGDGRFVTVSGMSEGTRDQLYFALRIAALELHLRQSAPLPFIADDLFVNFDDERARAGLSALKELSTHTQVIFLTHHDHLLNVIAEVFGAEVNVVRLTREQNVETST